MIDDSYDYPFGLVQQITLKDFPMMDFGERVQQTLDAVIEDQRDSLERLGQFGPVLRGMAYRVNDIEEAVGGFFELFVKEIWTERMLEPVIKSFRTLAVVIITALVAYISFEGILKTVLFGAGVALAVMATLLVLEVALVARREASSLPGMSALEEADRDSRG